MKPLVLPSRRALAALSASILALAALGPGCGAGSAGAFVAPGSGGSGTGTGGGGAGGGGGAAPAPPLRAQAIAVGASHTCAILDGGAVACWGDGARGQLGDGMAGTGHHRARAVRVPHLTGATALAAGGDTTCAVVGGGAVCWGDGAFGQLGDGTAADGYFQASPVAAAGLAGIVDLAVSGSSACAVLADGTVRCWGRNTAQGWLGFTSADCGPYASQDSSSSPTQPCEKTPRAVPGVSSAVEIAAGSGHVCALGADGGLICWGADGFGQLGDGFSGPQAHDPSPAPVAGVGQVVRVALGTSHSCAVTGAQRTLSCWGDNAFGQLGLGTKALDSYRTKPAPVPGVDTLLDLHAEGRATCAILGDRTVRCWGDGAYLFPPGAGAVFAGTTSPTATPGVSSAVEVRTGGSHACARREDASVICWGLDDQGQLGNGKQGLGDYSLVAVIAPD